MEQASIEPNFHSLYLDQSGSFTLRCFNFSRHLLMLLTSVMINDKVVLLWEPAFRCGYLQLNTMQLAIATASNSVGLAI